MKAWKILLAALLGLAAAGAGASEAERVQGRFKLLDARTQKTVTQASYRGRPRVVFFGFTRCRVLCPTSLQRLGEALRLLGPEQAKLVPLFITLDPGRDTPAQMREFVDHFSPAIVPLWGKPKAVEAAMRSFHVQADKTDVRAGDDYQLDHPALFFLMDRQGRYVGTLSSYSKPEELAAALRRLLAGP